MNQWLYHLRHSYTKPLLWVINEADTSEFKGDTARCFTPKRTAIPSSADPRKSVQLNPALSTMILPGSSRAESKEALSHPWSQLYPSPRGSGFTPSQPPHYSNARFLSQMTRTHPLHLHHHHEQLMFSSNTGPHKGIVQSANLFMGYPSK